jgi:hypothetical protein
MTSTAPRRGRVGKLLAVFRSSTEHDTSPRNTAEGNNDIIYASPQCKPSAVRVSVRLMIKPLAPLCPANSRLLQSKPLVTSDILKKPSKVSDILEIPESEHDDTDELQKAEVPSEKHLPPSSALSKRPRSSHDNDANDTDPPHRKRNKLYLDDSSMYVKGFESNGRKYFPTESSSKTALLSLSRLGRRLNVRRRNVNL